MKMQMVFGLLVVGIAGAGMLGAGFVTTPTVAQSGTAVQDGSANTVQQGVATAQQLECPPEPGSSSQLVNSSAASSRTQDGSGTTQSVVTDDRTYEQKMWSFIKSTKYEHWAPAGDNGDFRESERPHGAFVKTYMNRTAAGNPEELPFGSLIIKENYSPEKVLVAVTLMYRAEGYNPDANDWYWIKYNADGTTAMMDMGEKKMPIAGKASGCIDCHSAAGGDDYAYFND